MADIVRLNTLAKLNATLTAGSLAALAQAHKAQRTTFLLVDCSYSMRSDNKMVNLRRIVQELNSDGIVPPMVGFGISTDPVTEVGMIEAVPQPCGNTPLAKGIRFANTQGATHLIVISDGVPDNPQAALNAAYEFGGPIDVFFVGIRPNQGEDFLHQLAGIGGGSYQSVSLSGETKVLSSGLRKLLGA